MIKLVVGLRSMEEFASYQKRDRMLFEGQQANPVWTRHRPKRADELIESGSIYRVFDGRIRCRQKIIGFAEGEDPHKGKMCLIMVDPEIITTIAQPHRPFQGWRYLDPAKAPKDVGVYNESDDVSSPPLEMEAELREAGLL